MGELTFWRHPKPIGAEGRCIGRTDLGVDRRKSKRLAHRIRAQARRRATPRLVLTSPLRRSADVGRWLEAWGWTHRIDPRLAELDFGDWDGRTWSEIAPDELEAWTSSFAAYRPGGGESVGMLIERCRNFVAEQAPESSLCVVTHAGWISAYIWLDMRAADLAAQSWPRAIGYAHQVELRLPAALL